MIIYYGNYGTDSPLHVAVCFPSVCHQDESEPGTKKARTEEKDEGTKDGPAEEDGVSTMLSSMRASMSKDEMKQALEAALSKSVKKSKSFLIHHYTSVLFNSQ